MSTAEIIAELPRLSSEELAQVQAKLSELVEPTRVTAQPKPTADRPPRIHSPRLAHREQSKDFVKQVVELAPDAEDDAWCAATSPQSQRAWDED